MKTRRAGLLAATSLVLLALAACATPQQWETWRTHPTHFASGQHAMFSMRNKGEVAERVKPTDPANATEQAWWGRELPMAQ